MTTSTSTFGPAPSRRTFSRGPVIVAALLLVLAAGALVGRWTAPQTPPAPSGTVGPVVNQHAGTGTVHHGPRAAAVQSPQRTTHASPELCASLAHGVKGRFAYDYQYVQALGC